MEKLLSNKTVIVTGASGEIGSAVALKFAQEGANVVINYNTNSEAADELSREINDIGPGALAVKASVTDSGAVEMLVKKAVEKFGRIDILVNNAGVVKDSFLMLMKEEAWDQVLNTNLKSLYYCCKAVLKTMLKQKSGNIVNISSLSGAAGRIGQTNYAASKGGVIAFTKSLAQELGKKKIRVNTVAPGLINSETVKQIPEGYINLNAIPLNRLGEPEEVAKAVLFLASDMSSYITGAVLHVNGGLYM